MKTQWRTVPGTQQTAGLESLLPSEASEDGLTTTATLIQTLPYLGEVVVLLGVSLQAQLAQQDVISSLHYLVEDVKVSFPVILMHHPRLLQQVVQDMAPDGIPLRASTS